MRVLDLGCGAGDVSLIAAAMVGPRGSVVGVDRDGKIIETAQERVRKARLEHVSFLKADIDSLEPDRVFDAVVGRLILMYLSEPARTIRRLVGHVRSGGVIAFQEADWTNPPLALPRSRQAEQIYAWMVECFKTAGVETQMGLKLATVFRLAGLPEPQLRLEAPVGSGANWEGFAYAANSIRSLLPALISFNIATAEEVDIDNLAARLRDEVISQNGVLSLSPFISAWATRH